MAFGGTALKTVALIVYGLAFCCSALILGVYSYFLSVLADRDVPIDKNWQAVTGMSGAGVLYTAFAVLLTCCLGGKSFFAFLAIVLNVLFTGAFVAIAVLTRDGSQNCSNTVVTPIGTGPSNAKEGFGREGESTQITYAVSLGTACRLNSASFAVAIAGALLFLIAALVQVALGRHHKKEKRFGPSPANNYTRGSGIKFWQRRRAKRNGLRDPEMAGAAAPAGTLAPATVATDYRHSHDTAYTGSTVAPHSATYENPHKPLVGGYHTAPTGTYNTTHNATPATNY